MSATEYRKAALQRRGITYRKLAEEIGISVQTVSDAINGHNDSASTRYAIAHAASMPVGDLWPECEAQRLALSVR